MTAQIAGVRDHCMSRSLAYVYMITDGDNDDGSEDVKGSAPWCTISDSFIHTYMHACMHTSDTIHRIRVVRILTVCIACGTRDTQHMHTNER